MSNVPTNKLGTAEQLRDADIILLRKMYGCGKTLNILISILINVFSTLYSHKNLSSIDLNYTTPPPPPCKNKYPDATCTKYAGWGVCKGQYYDFMLKNCAKACNYC